MEKLLTGVVNRRITRVALVLALGVGAGLASCRPEVCQKMVRCCRAIQDREGVGKACGPRATGVEDAETCRTILEATEVMFQHRGEKLPPACR